MGIRFYDYRENIVPNNSVEASDPRFSITGYAPPSIGVDRDTVNGLALTKFLEYVDELSALHMYNAGFKDDYDPFSGSQYFIGNHGIGIVNDTFILHSYDWDDFELDDAEDSLWRNVQGGRNATCFCDFATKACVSWYKYVPRGLCVNDIMLKILNDDETSSMLERVHSSLNA